MEGRVRRGELRRVRGARVVRGRRGQVVREILARQVGEREEREMLLC